MYIYLPIAEMPVSIPVILLFGGVTGVLSGMFGVGGGFLMTPLLIFNGIPAPVAVASSANQIIGASFSGFLAHLRKKNVDIALGMTVVCGGLVGASAGVGLFAFLKKLGQIDLVISLCYVVFLGGVGGFMAWESIREILLKKKIITRRVKKTPEKENETNESDSNDKPPFTLPWKVTYTRSNINVSILLPLAIGLFTGMLVSLMGIGGGFILVPAMIYLLRMPTSVVIGTSLFQIIFITITVTILQAVTTHSVDIVLAGLMLVSSVIGAQFGTRIGTKLPAEQLRAALALLVLAVVIKLAYGLFATPESLYTVEKIT